LSVAGTRNNDMNSWQKHLKIPNGVIRSCKSM